MLLVILILFCSLIVLGVLHDFGVLGNWQIDGAANADVPKIIHLMYFPWHRNQRLKSNLLDFDHTYWRELERRYPDFTVMMWTMPAIKSFLDKHYPGLLEESLQLASRPTQLVDLFRWVVVYHFGGVYIQYGSHLHAHPLHLFPSRGFTVRLYTEMVWFWSILQYVPAYLYDIRQGLPEEKYRIMNQVFAAVPKDPYVLLTWTTILHRMQLLGRPTCDYDILFIGANAFVSELYENIGKRNESIELANFAQSKNLIHIHSRASWRTD